MDRALRLCALLWLCAPGAAWVRTEEGLSPGWSPAREESDTRASVGPEGEAPQDHLASCSSPDSSSSTNPWRDGCRDFPDRQGSGNIRPDGNPDFALQVFILSLGVAAFACVACCYSYLLNWLASDLENHSETEHIPMTYLRGYGIFGDTAPQPPGSEDTQATQLL